MKRTRENMLLDSLKSPRTPFNEFRQRVFSIETVTPRPGEILFLLCRDNKGKGYFLPVVMTTKFDYHYLDEPRSFSSLTKTDRFLLCEVGLEYVSTLSTDKDCLDDTLVALLGLLKERGPSPDQGRYCFSLGGQPEYMVVDVVDHVGTGNGRKYKVKWEDGSFTWEWQKNLVDIGKDGKEVVNEALLRYLERRCTLSELCKKKTIQQRDIDHREEMVLV